jgi:glutamate-1-semialdehyde 2,1-aminomutase
MLEPVQGAAGMIEATQEFVERLRAVTQRLGIVLVFDEVVTFPIAYGGAQAWFGVTPDLTTMSKAIGGGLPLSAVGGRAEIMDLLDPELYAGIAPVTSVSTFGGNLASLAAGIAALELLTPEVHAHIQALGDRARSGIDELGRAYDVPLHSTGLGHLFGMHWAPERVVDYATRMRTDRAKIVNLHLALMNEGYYQMSLGYFLLSAAHEKSEIESFLAALERALHTLDYV